MEKFSRSKKHKKNADKITVVKSIYVHIYLQGI